MNNEDVYIGNFINGEYFGKGLLRKGMRFYKEKSIQDMKEFISSKDIEFKQEKIKEIYDGDFVSGKKWGEGIMILDNVRYEGTFIDDKFVKGKASVDNGELKLGKMIDGKFIEEIDE